MIAALIAGVAVFNFMLFLWVVFVLLGMANLIVSIFKPTRRTHG